MKCNSTIVEHGSARAAMIVRRTVLVFAVAIRIMLVQNTVMIATSDNDRDDNGKGGQFMAESQ